MKREPGFARGPPGLTRPAPDTDRAPTWQVQVREGRGTHSTAGWCTFSFVPERARRGAASLTAWSRPSATPRAAPSGRFIRLVVGDDGRIADADADGLDRDLARHDAARGRCRRRRPSSRSTRSRTRSARSFARRPSEGRTAVAMSGGVDSAVALLRVEPGRDRRHASSLGSIPTGRQVHAPSPTCVMVCLHNSVCNGFFCYI